MAAHHCDDSDSVISSYRSWLHTPPSLRDVAFRVVTQCIDIPLSPLRSTAIMGDMVDLAPSPHMPLSIQVRKARVLLFTSVVVATLLTLIVVFARGVPVKTIEGNWSDDAERELVNDYNFYSGTVASVVAKPFELCVTMLLPVMHLVFATKFCLYDDSMQWKIVLIALQAGFVTLLTSAFSSLNVQLLPPSLSPIVVASDLLSADASTAGSVDTAVLLQGIATDPHQLRPSTETILRTAMESTAVKNGTNQCRGNGEWLGVLAVHSFPNTAWLKDMLPQGLPPTKSVQVNIGEVLRAGAHSSGTTRAPLPFEMRMGANLLLHSMVISEAILPWTMLSGNINSSYDKFLWSTTATEHAGDLDGFLYAAGMMLNSSLHVQARALNYSVDEVTLNFTHFDISRDLVFDAVTIDIPYEARAMKRTLGESGIGLFEVADDDNKPASPQSNSSVTAKYDVATMTECGTTSCLIKDSEARAQGTKRRTLEKSTAPQVQAFASCEYDSGTEDVTIDFLHGHMCQRRLNTSMLVYSLGKRIVADSMVLNPVSKNPATQIGHFTNIRKYQTITLGRLAWKTHDVAARFNAVCNVSEANGCNGLSYRLDGNESRYLVVGEDHLPLSALGPFEGIRSQWTPLVMLSTSLTSDLLVQRNIKNNNASWEIDGRCSDAVETLTKRIESNRWYMEHGLQEAYTSALFFLFQNAALRDTWYQSSDVETLAFAGSRVATKLQARIPLQSALLSIGVCSVLLLGVVAAVILSKRKEPSIQEGLDVHRVAKMLLGDQSFPKVFLQCTLHDDETRIKHPLGEFHIESMCLKQCAAQGQINGTGAVDDPFVYQATVVLPQRRYTAPNKLFN
ncbi:hypothetical protein FI667_g4093, partial [Globisporangium splendens]